MGSTIFAASLGGVTRILLRLLRNPDGLDLAGQKLVETVTVLPSGAGFGGILSKTVGIAL